MIKLKRLLALVVIIAVVFGFSAMSIAAGEIGIIIDGVALEAKDANGMPVYPVIIEGTTYLPVRALGEAFNKTVVWNGSTNTVYINGESANLPYTETVKIVIDGVLIDPRDANGKSVPPFIKDGTTYLPVRAVGEAFNKNVEWDGDNRRVIITSRESARRDELVYYAGFGQIPDFGAYFNIAADIMSSEEMYIYSNAGAKQKDEYVSLLVSLGFEQIDEMQTAEVSSVAYAKNGEVAVIALFTLGASDKFVGINLVKQQDEIVYKGELRFYGKYPRVPDYGAVNALPLKAQTDVAANMTQYDYGLSEGSEGVYELLAYCDALEKSGFIAMVEGAGTAMYINQATQNTVLINTTSTGIAIIVEQWPDRM